MRLYLVRHGETENNRLGLFQGHCDALLTSKGVIQAENLGFFFRNHEFDLGLVSTLQRSQTTFAISRLAKRCQEVHNTKLLWELGFGIYEGDQPSRHTVKPNSWDERYIGGESFKDLYERVEKAFGEFITFDWKEEKDVLILAHGVTNKVIRGFISKTSFPNIMKSRIQSNNEVVKLTIDSKGIRSRIIKV